MTKTRNDEEYERGVHDGQTDTFLGQLVHSIACNHNSIYSKGYSYGLDNPSSDKDD